ncbi:GD21696 [Drosophila simulans]|uniref:GD21696 n=1 Tax=Drosophila simulans TaxID=7240 RepID=B4Q3E5_DROSI|nr:GD21696 [Drosophila simulans]
MLNNAHCGDVDDDEDDDDDDEGTSTVYKMGPRVLSLNSKVAGGGRKPLGQWKGGEVEIYLIAKSQPKWAAADVFGLSVGLFFSVDSDSLLGCGSGPKSRIRARNLSRMSGQRRCQHHRQCNHHLAHSRSKASHLGTGLLRNWGNHPYRAQARMPSPHPYTDIPATFARNNKSA